MGLTSGRTCTPTPSCLEAPPCTPVLLTVCRRRSLPWLPPPSRSRSSHPQRGSTPFGSEDPSSPPSPPSSRCGSPSRSTMSLAPALSTGNASKQLTSPSLNACCLQDRQNNQVAPSSHCDLRGHPMTWFQSNLCHLLFLV